MTEQVSERAVPAGDGDIEIIRDAVRALCRRFDDDYWAACEADHRFPTEFYGEMARGTKASPSRSPRPTPSCGPPT